MFKKYRIKFERTPFMGAAGIGLLGIIGGALASIADIIWLIYDTAAHFNVVYAIILIMLSLSLVVFGFGIYFTLKLIQTYKSSGLYVHELTVCQQKLESEIERHQTFHR